MHVCLPWVVFPMVLFLLVAAMLHVHLVPPVHAAAEHRRQDDDSDQEGQDAGQRDARTLHLVDP